MKIVLVTEYFYPVSKGGTEQYVYFLAKGLQTLNHEVCVIAVHETLKRNNYEGIEVLYIKPYLGLESRVIKGFEPANNLSAFEQLILDSNADIFHFHTFTTSINHHHIAVAKKHQLKTIFTSHIPDHICLTGGLRQNGYKICNGKIGTFKCAFCYACSKNENILIKSLRFLKSAAPLENSAVNNKKRDLKMLNTLCDQLIVVSDWQKAYWENNVVPYNPILICRQGVKSINPIKKIKRSEANVTLGFVGRISEIKGLHLIFEALKTVADSSFELKIAGIASNTELDYYNRLKATKLISKVQWQLNLNAEEIAKFYQEIDYLVIPSLWLETGPFVAYEALAQGVPIIGSNLGGIKELVKEGVNGILFEPTAKNLALVLKKLKSGEVEFNVVTNEVRLANMISLEMQTIYKQVLSL